MNWKDLESALGAIAPILGTAIGGPAKDAIGTLISTVLGVGNTPDAVAEAVKNNPDAALKLQQLANDREKELLQVHLAAVQAEYADAASARARDIEIIKSGKSNTRADVMVAGAVLGLVACLVVLVLFQGTIPGEAVGIIATVAGVFGSCLKDAYGFEFGSSRGSKEKDQLFSDLMKGK